jgi:hypothetical protein
MTIMTPEQHLVTSNVLGSQPAGHSVSVVFAACTAAQTNAVKRRVLKDTILGSDFQVGDVEELKRGVEENSLRTR